MRMTPLRPVVEVFAVAAKRTVALPVPLGGPTASQDTDDAVDQPHDAPALTTTLPAEFEAGREAPEAESDTAHPAPEACVRTKVLPPIVTFADRGDPVGFDVKDIVTVPGPIPDAGDTVSHEAPEAVVHAHEEDEASNDTIEEPDEDGAETAADGRFRTQDESPGCRSVNSRSPMRNAAVRVAPVVFADTRQNAVPASPDGWLVVMVTHCDSDESRSAIDHAQLDDSPATAMANAPPPVGTTRAPGPMPRTHDVPSQSPDERHGLEPM